VNILGLHRITSGTLAVRALGGGGGEESDIDIVVLHQLLELRKDVGLDELLALGRALCGGGATVLLELAKGRGLVVGKFAQDINDDGVRFGHVEADVGDGIVDELLEDREDGACDDREGERRCKGLADRVSRVQDY
jgi:hypothetical protein